MAQNKPPDQWHVVSNLHGSVGNFNSLKEARDFSKAREIPISKPGGSGYFIKKNYGK